MYIEGTVIVDTFESGWRCQGRGSKMNKRLAVRSSSNLIAMHPV